MHNTAHPAEHGRIEPSASEPDSPAAKPAGRRGAFLGNVSLGKRISLLLALPVAMSIWLAETIVVQKWSEVTETERIGELSALAGTISAFVHEMQKERGASALFIGAKGARFADVLDDQRKLTDEKRAAVDKALSAFDSAAFGAKIANQIAETQKAMTGIGEARGAVSALKVTVGGMARYYTDTIVGALHVIEAMAGLTESAAIANAITGYTAFLQAKENAGIERAMGAAGFSSGRFAGDLYLNFAQKIEAQERLTVIFRDHASDAQIAFHDKTMSGPAVDDVLRMRKAALASAGTGNTGGVTGGQWFDAATRRIELMKTVEDRLAGDLIALAERLHDAAQRVFLTLTSALAGLLALIAVLAFAIIRGITRPVAGLTRVTGELADGNLDAEIDVPETGDEIGALVKSIKVFKENLVENRRLQAEQAEAERRAAEEESRRQQEALDRQRREAEQTEQAAAAQKARAEKIGAMIDAFNGDVMAALDTVSSAAAEMQATAQSMANTAEHTSSQSAAVAAASEQATSNVQTVATAAEELAASVQEVGRQVEESARIASNAVTEAGATNAKVQGLAEAASKIGEVVNLINDIASQTNLLALNATIEAARAGDAGKGFAVVASEVKSLANQTAKATEEIAGQIGAIQSATGDAVTAIGAISQTIGQVNEIASSIASAVEEQGTATREIAGNVQQAAQGTQEITDNIAKVNTAASETGSASTQVLAAAGELATQGDQLRGRITRFLEEVRAA